MDNSADLEKKYGIVYIDKRRYYKQDLVEKPYGLETTAPISLETPDTTFIIYGWKELLLEVLRFYLPREPEVKEYFLAYKYPWKDYCPFTTVESKYAIQVYEGLCLICNQSAQHACWLLRDILIACKVDLAKCKLIIHKPPYAEPEECKNYFKEKTVNSFRYYCKSIKQVNEAKTEQIVQNIERFNKYLAKMSLSYNDFFLFDNFLNYDSYRCKFLEYIKNMCLKEKNIVIIKYCLNLLGDYYNAVY